MNASDPGQPAARQFAPVLRGMAWMAVGGLTLCTMNGVMRILTQQLDPLQSQFLRYVFGLAVPAQAILLHQSLHQMVST